MGVASVSGFPVLETATSAWDTAARARCLNVALLCAKAARDTVTLHREFLKASAAEASCVQASAAAVLGLQRIDAMELKMASYQLTN